MIRGRGRKSDRERIRAINAAHRFYAQMSVKPVSEEITQSLQRAEPRVRAPSKPSDVPLERAVLAAVLRALRSDPRVALVERSQSGVFQDGDRFIRVGSRGKLDITLMMVGGRYGEIEVKRPGGKPTAEQAERIATIRANGGIAGYATSVDEALALLTTGGKDG